MTGPAKRDEGSLSVGNALGHGMTFAVSTLLFLLAGNWADGKLGTGPVLAIVGTLVGASAGFYSMVRHLTESNRKGSGPGSPE